MKVPTCKICTEEFTDENGCRVPKTLHCSHSICLSCAGNTVVNNEIICPFCREATELGPGGVQSLKKNFALLEVIEDAKFSKNQLERELTQTSLPRCPAHSYNLAEFICINKECKSANKLMCRTCEEFGVHKGHEKGLLQEECTKLRELMRKAHEKLDEAHLNVSKYLEDIQWCRLTYSTNGKEYLSEVNRINLHFEKIRREVDENEEEALQTLRNFSNNTIEEIDSSTNDIIVELDKIERKQADLDQLIGLPNSDLLTNQSEVIHSCDKIDSEPPFEQFPWKNMQTSVKLPVFSTQGYIPDSDDEE